MIILFDVRPFVCLFSKTEVLNNILWYLDANFLTDCLFLIVKTVTPGQYLRPKRVCRLIHFFLYMCICLKSLELRCSLCDMTME